MKKILSILLVFGLIHSIQIIEPFLRETSTGDTVFLGMIGPGQTVYISIHPKVYSGGIHGIGGNYDLAYFSALPEGWSAKKSHLYGDPLQIKLTASPEAEAGDYYVNVNVDDEGDGEELGNITFVARVTIDHNVMETEIYPSKKSVSVGQPARFKITVYNTGSTGDVFRIHSEGVPKWDFQEAVYIPAKGKRDIYYEVVAFEEESYSFSVIVESTSSPLIREEMSAEVSFYPSIFSDMKAVNNGALVFPIIEAPIYSILGLLSNLW
ncbi:hypothetical protein KAW38_00605 [Candidatus Micrarchaeota archaeon]|nr:hypothetical protein [Candidatus Micrarchaeota archaeon]